ncbi:hypothetical protein [Prevotella pectinovora]|uniref:hypothetical protein n=1 Tax=Prevotella pectinovora TaxID=1602169 RepID=UPI00307CF786
MNTIKKLATCCIALAAALNANAIGTETTSTAVCVQNINAQWTGDATGFWKARIGANVKDIPNSCPGLYSKVDKTDFGDGTYLYSYLKNEEEEVFSVTTDNAGTINSVSIAMGSGIELSLMGIKVTADTKYHTLMKAVPTKIKWVLNLGELRLNLGSEKVYCEPFIRDLTQRGHNKLAKMKDTERLIPVTLSDIEPDAILWKITIE